jgi:hypothetical protein
MAQLVTESMTAVATAGPTEIVTDESEDEEMSAR